MPDSSREIRNPERDSSALLWDMAGTLIAYDPVTGRPAVIPGAQEYLPELGKDFRLFVSTGDEGGHARSLLRSFGLIEHFEEVFGDLAAGLGKPYGHILKQMGCDPRRSLAIGDRLNADIPTDTPDVVLILVNQREEMLNAGMISFVIGLLRTHGEIFPEAFASLAEKAEEMPDEAAAHRSGCMTRAWQYRQGLRFMMYEFKHALLDERRLVIEI